jgi:hypothetical protein
MIDQGIGVAEANNADMLMGKSLQDLLGLANPTLLSGGSIANDVTDPVNDVAFATGVFRDSTNTVTMIADTAMIKQLDVAWAAGTGQGGRMSAAAIADVTYYCFAIMSNADGSVDFGFDVSSTAPTLPSGYTYFRRIGTILRAGGTILAFQQDGRYFALKTPITDVNVSNPGVAAVLRTLSVPIGQRVLANVFVAFFAPTLADIAGGILLTDPGCVDVIPTGIVATVIVYDGVTRVSNGGAMAQVWTNTAGQIRSRLQFSAANTSLRITTFGWTDSL